MGTRRQYPFNEVLTNGVDSSRDNEHDVIIMPHSSVTGINTVDCTSDVSASSSADAPCNIMPSSGFTVHTVCAVNHTCVVSPSIYRVQQ